MPDADAHPGMAQVRRTTRDVLAAADDTPGRSPFIAGHRFTGADIGMPLRSTTAPRFRAPDLTPCPSIGGCVARIGDCPAYRHAMDVAGPDVVP